MNSPNLQHSHRDAPDAFLDQLELDLVALSTATLDDDAPPPSQVVDEFATEFLMHVLMPPK